MTNSTEQGRLVVGRYRLVECIGRGGMGTVWRAEDELLGRQVAVKRLRAPQAHMHHDELATLFERTRREARSAARISHPNVVVVHDVVNDEGLPTIVMEYVPSTTLGELIKDNGPVSPAEAALIGRGMIAALRAAHAAGVLHRDVKPGNVLLGTDGRVVLTDFGIAQASGTSSLTRTGELVGSIDFLAPERLTGGAGGPEADLWALGATLFQAVEGRAPFRKETPLETAYAIASEEIPVSEAAGPLAPLIAGLLVREPQSRLSAEDAERLLRESAADTQTAGRLPAGPAALAQAPAQLPARLQTPEQAPPAPLPSGQRAPSGEPPNGPTPRASRAAPSRRRRGGRSLWLIACAAVGAVLAVILTVRGFGGTDGTGGGYAQAAQSTADTSSAPAYTVPPLPSGYRLAKEPLGFDIPVPKGWTREAKGARYEVDYLSPDKSVVLRVDVQDYAGPSPLQTFQEWEPKTTSRVDDYEQLRLSATRWHGQPAAMWEYLFKGEGGAWHAKNLGIGKEGGMGYAVSLSAPEAQWGTYKHVFDNAASGLIVRKQ